MYHPDVLIQVQRELELQDINDGAEKYMNAQDRKARLEGFDRRDDVKKMMRDAVPRVAQALRQWIETASTKRGRPSAALAPLKELDAEVVALQGLSVTFREMAMAKTITSTTRVLGEWIEREIEGKLIQETDPKVAKRFLAMAEGERNTRVLTKRHKALADELELSLDWTQRTQVLVGGVVLNLVLTAVPDIFERSTIKDHRGVLPIVKLTTEAAEALTTMAEAVAFLRPLRRPMIAPPRAWTHFDTGAYLEYSLSKSVPLVRGFNKEHHKLVREALSEGKGGEMLEGLNAIQATRFAIDRRVFDVMGWVRGENRQPSASFPKADPVAAIVKLPAEEWEALTPEARSAMSRKRKSAENLRNAASTNVGVFTADYDEAERLLGVEAFYLPHNFDFRGRVYAVPHFNPQRSDHIKALFRFADTLPLGKHGAKWLAIHLANNGDFKTPEGRKCSKATFADRVAWVEANEPAILAAARDPQGTYDWWSTADSPFCFLQACFEWEAYVRSGYSEAFESCVGVALDGSCSGLQHYSAMTRSAEEGYHVNLLSRETPGDIYQVTADQGRPYLEAAAAGSDPMKALAASTILANGFGRGETKRNVMTYFYGSAQFGMRDQHMVDLMRPLADKVALGELTEHPYALLTDRENKETGEVTQALDGGFTCARVLAEAVYKAITSVAPKADEAANWFQAVAATLAHESLPVIWTTPVGLPVMQKYSEYTSKAVNVWLYDRNVQVPKGRDKVDEEGNVLTRVQTLVREAPTKRINKKRARSAISPNVIHSLDGSHLVRTVVFAAREGIKAFQLIHDSFATHAGATERFFGVIREAFVDQYETYDPFEQLETYARSVLSDEGADKLPPRPTRGTLDLRAILESDYAFA